MEAEEKRYRNRLLGLLFAGVLMGALDIAIIGPALPAIRRGFGVDDRAAAWVLTIYVLFNLIGTPLMAKLSDRFGRRAVYVADVAIFALGSLIVATSPTFGVLLGGRAVQGLGSGGIFPVASAVIGDVFPLDKRGRALGLIGAVFGVAFLVGPILGGVLLMIGWPVLFLVNLPIAAVVIYYALRLLPAGAPAGARAFDIGGMTLLGVVLAALAFGVNRIDAAHFFTSVGSTAVFPYLLAALLLAPLFWAVERRADDPVVRPALFRSRQVILASALALGAGLSESSIVFVPALLVASFGVSASTAAFMLMPIVVAMAIGAPISGRLLDRHGSRAIVVGGTALIGAGMILVSFFPATLAVFYAAGLLIGVGLAALLGSSLRYVMLNEAPASERAAAQGILTVFTSIGQLVGAALVGALVASHGGGSRGFGLAFLVVGAAMVGLSLLSLGLKGRQEEIETVRRNERGRQSGAAGSVATARAADA